jgi:Rv2525c-like, glycoside hydrolase-like domain
MRSFVVVLLLAATLHAQSFLGFDRNIYPGDNSLAALHKTFAFTGYWLNNPPGATSNSWTGKRAIIEKAGFGFVVLFTGKTYAQLKGNEAEEVGAADGQAAIEAAKREGFPAATIIFLDQEEGGRLLEAQKDYLFAWIDAVNSAGFRAGVYCSGIPATESSGETVVTADDIRKNAGDRHIVYFVAADSCPPSPGCVYPKVLPEPKDSGTDYADLWQYVQSPRRKDYTQSCAQTYNADGNCYPPNIAPTSGLHLDLDVATEADPSHGRASK